MQINSLFISKNEADLNDLSIFCELRDIQLTAHSFLLISAIEVKIDFNYDIIFFSSKNAVEYFLKSNEIKADAKIGVAGTGTKTFLESYGYYVDFNPKESGDITQSTQEFKEWVGNKRVLFPISSISHRSYANSLKSEQSYCKAVYETEIHSKRIASHDIYVFTSPSNVDGFFQENELFESSKIISWGETTTNALAKYKHSPYIELKTSGTKELINILRSLSDN